MSDMTRKEAIKNLKELLKWYLEEEMLSETVYKREAVDMAISALSESKRDLISRGEVESVLHNNLHALIDKDQLYQLYKDINRLPTYSSPDSAEIKEEWIPVGWIPNGKCGYPKPEDEYKHFLTIDNKGE